MHRSILCPTYLPRAGVGIGYPRAKILAKFPTPGHNFFVKQPIFTKNCIFRQFFSIKLTPPPTPGLNFLTKIPPPGQDLFPNPHPCPGGVCGVKNLTAHYEKIVIKTNVCKHYSINYLQGRCILKFIWYLYSIFVFFCIIRIIK